MNEKNQETFMVIAKPKKTPEEQLKWQIETDLFYLFECKHCMIVTLVEEATDNFKDPKHPDEILAKCPICFTDNLIPKNKNRLKLKLEKIMDPDEINPYYAKLSKNIEFRGIDY